MQPNRPFRSGGDERGIALVGALLALILTGILATTFMAMSVGEQTLSSNVHIARGSLLSADAGVRTMQQVLANMAQVKLDSALSVWPGVPGTPVITNPQTLFPAGDMVQTATNPRFSAAGSIVFSDTALSDTSQVYDYTYTITASGEFGRAGGRSVQSKGILRVSASRGSFADYLLFTHVHTTPSGGAIWFSSDANYDGRVHTNGKFRFAYEPTFQDQVTSVNTKAWFYNKGAPKDLASDHNGTIDVPQFYGGFSRGADVVPLPTNSYNQQNAALGLDPTSSTAPTNSQVNGQLGTGAGSGTPPNGIYLVNSGGAVTGGLYVQGNLDQMLARVDSLGRQVYVMTQGGTTKTIVIDRVWNTTSVTVGASTTTYTGVPRGIAYVNGALSDMRGPDRVDGVPPPAIADNNQVLIAATGDIVVKRDVTLNNYNTGQSVVGLYSSAGNVRIGNSASGAPNNMYLDAYVMAIGAAGAFTVDNYDSGSPRGTFHLRGGMVTRYYGAFYTFDTSGKLKTGYARDFHYDRRGLVPPYYPSTNLFNADDPSARTLVWKEI